MADVPTGEVGSGGSEGARADSAAVEAAERVPRAEAPPAARQRPTTTTSGDSTASEEAASASEGSTSGMEVEAEAEVVEALGAPAGSIGVVRPATDYGTEGCRCDRQPGRSSESARSGSARYVTRTPLEKVGAVST